MFTLRYHSLTKVEQIILFLVLPLCAAIAVPAFGPDVRAASSTCSTSGPSSGLYGVTLCITSPAPGASLTGAVSVTASTTFTGTAPAVQRIIYSLDSNYLLTTFNNSPYAFTFPTYLFANGTHSLQAQALMNDGFTSQQAGISVSIQNNIVPTPTTAFTPAPGTLPQSGQPFVVVAGGDGAGGESNASNVVSLINTWNPNLFLYLGDVYEEGTDTEFYNWYAPTSFFGKFRTITDPTIGNHEYLTGSPAGYFDYWNNPPNYYSFNAGGWHFISLNSNCSSISGCGTTSPQYLWVQNDLAANANVCTIAFWHAPIYDIGPEAGEATGMTATWSLLAQNSVSVVLNGHDHDYQRWVPLDGSGNPSPNGITEFVVGSTGHGIQQFTTTDTRLAFGSDTAPTTFGALRMQLSLNQIAFQYINTAGTTLDSGTIPCGKVSQTPTATPTATRTATATATATATSTAPAGATLTPTLTPTRPPSVGHSSYKLYLPLIVK